MIRNQSYFVPPVRQETYLEARGFNSNGLRSGGIIDPQEAMLPAGAVLLRFYHDPNRKFGAWWNTMHELGQIVDYFARSGPALATGRLEGRGILHGSLVVRHDWAGATPLHLAKFFVVKLKETLKAFHGEGDHAPDSSQRQIQKSVRIIDNKNRQRPARQIFLPKIWLYPDAVIELSAGDTDTDLETALSKFGRAALSFEN